MQALTKRRHHFHLWVCLPLMLIVFAFLALPSLAQETKDLVDETNASFAAPEKTDDKLNEDDRAIDERIESILQQMDGMQGVRVRVSAGVVSLTGEVPELTQIEEAEAIATKVEGVIAVRNSITQVDSVSEQIQPAMERMLERVESFLVKVPILLIAALVFLIISALGFWLAARRRPWDTIAPNGFIADLLRQFVRIVFIAIGVVTALDLLGATALLTTILGAAGIVGLAVGFAVRDTVENYIASILLSLRQPFRPNDYVDIDGVAGTILRLTSRATVLMSADGNHIRIPNATVFKGTITNYSRNAERRYNFVLSIARHCNPDKAISIGVETMEKTGFTLENPKPRAWIDNVGPSTIEIFFAGWINQTESDFARSRSEAIRRVMQNLQNAGIEMPEPTYRVEMAGAISSGNGEPNEDMIDQPKIGPSLPEDDPSHDTGVDNSIENLANDERKRGRGNNWLNPKGRQEL